MLVIILHLIALIPMLIFNFASKKGTEWLTQWEKQDANLQQLPYELLIVNVSTIGIHFLTGSSSYHWSFVERMDLNEKYSISLDKFNQIRRHL